MPSLAAIQALEVAIARELPLLDLDALTHHHFILGGYIRELRLPKGSVAVGMMHAQENFFLLTKGDVTILTREGMKRVQAPQMVVTQPGDKRVAYAHEDTVMLNFHPNPDDEHDLKKLETRYTVRPALEREYLLALGLDPEPAQQLLEEAA